MELRCAVPDQSMLQQVCTEKPFKSFRLTRQVHEQHGAVPLKSATNFAGHLSLTVFHQLHLQDDRHEG